MWLFMAIGEKCTGTQLIGNCLANDSIRKYPTISKGHFFLAVFHSTFLTDLCNCGVELISRNVIKYSE